VLSIANISVPLGPDSGQVEIVGGRWFAIQTQLEMALPDEPARKVASCLEDGAAPPWPYWLWPAYPDSWAWRPRTPPRMPEQAGLTENVYTSCAP